MTSPSSVQSAKALREAWAALRERQPKLRIRDAAAELGVTEAELLATRCGAGVRRLEVDLARILPRLEALGELMALTRNDIFVHEKTGRYRNVYFDPHVASVIDRDIDLRIFPGCWAHGFAVETEGRSGPRRSLQFFDPHGVAVHKIFLRDGSNLSAYEALVEDLLHEDRSSAQPVAVPAPPPEPRPDEAVDVKGLESDWRGIRDTHDFIGLLRRHEVTRTQALRLVPERLARPAANGALRRALQAASANDIELMIFVRSPGTWQIHHGAVKRIVEARGWLNVLDPGFSLHVREGEIASGWVVRKPTDTGWVTAVELYDAGDALSALLFGCRAEGAPENPEWRSLAQGLP